MAGTLTVQNLQGPSSGANANKIIVPSGQELYAAGHVVQVVSTTKTDVFTTTSASFVDIAGLSLAITPTSASSKVLVQVNVSLGGVDNYYAEFNLTRNGTTIGAYTGGGGTAGFMGQNSVSDFAQYYLDTPSNSFLDSPASTSSLTYQLQIASMNGAAPSLYVNRTADQATTVRCTGVSTLTLMEIAQ
jgi:hypothetical protein